MGKVTGFMEFERVDETYEAPVKRLHHYKEFVAALTDAEAKVQGARCMDCGIPFCNNGCPVNNIIPDFNDLVFHDDWKNALDVLQSTNNFPEFTGRICPAPCEAACTLGINSDAVGIKSIEHAIIDKGWENGWVKPQPSKTKTGKKVAVVGGGPAGMATAQQLARVGHDVTVFEKNDRVGGLLRYGIPDFKMEKWLIDRRVEQMQAEGVKFETGVFVGKEAIGAEVKNYSTKTVSPDQLMKDFDAVVISGGSEQPRDLPVPGRELKGVHYALEFLIPQNKENAGDFKNEISAAGKHVVVIGGGVAGLNAAVIAMGMGADVTVLDRSLPRLAHIDTMFNGRIKTLASTYGAIDREVKSSDLVVGAVLVHGAKAPKLVTNEQVKGMKPGAVLVDIAIDQGGCFEDSRATTHAEPTFKVHDAIFYCVANMPGAVPVASTYALTNATLPYALSLAQHGWEAAIARDGALAKGLNVHEGKVYYEAVAVAHGYSM